MPKASSVQVEWEDQKNINEFNKLNNRWHELQIEVKTLERYAEDLEEAGNELMLVDDDEVRYAMSDCLFVHLPREELEELIEGKQRKAEQDLADTRARAKTAEKDMESLKATLYAKFGNSINLEED
ncbi:hypothetical protein BSKO_06413 [Bryopsis sp. KO-2023]|nr:hypothetical protein BSKO_06413 [Bryopsis sp. KO-2023]